MCLGQSPPQTLVYPTWNGKLQLNSKSLHFPFKLKLTLRGLNIQTVATSRSNSAHAENLRWPQQCFSPGRSNRIFLCQASLASPQRLHGTDRTARLLARSLIRPREPDAQCGKPYLGYAVPVKGACAVPLKSIALMSRDPALVWTEIIPVGKQPGALGFLAVPRRPSEKFKQTFGLAQGPFKA